MQETGDYFYLFFPHPTPHTRHPTPHCLGLVYVSRGEGCDKLIKERLSPSNYGGVTR
ncbi:MAG: hypothetical protein O9338_01780 [Microcystis sp. LE19-251.1A]|nr:hypothetical protein [Microcystis sp. LE19-251.1A]